jgi:hypothetical protein
MTVTKSPGGEHVGETATAETAAFTAMFCMGACVAAWGAYFDLNVKEFIDAIEAASLTLVRGIVSDDARRRSG